MNKTELDWERELSLIILDKSSHDLILQRIEKLEKRRALSRFFPAFSVVGAIALALMLFLPESGKLSSFVSNVLSGKERQLANTPSGSMRKPAPAPFEYPLVIKADPFPAHPNQIIQIQPEQNNWSGQNITIYLVNSQDFLYSKKVPEDAEKIGTAKIQNGTWEFQWKIANIEKDIRYASFLIAAESDTGIVSGKEISALNYESLDLSSKVVNIGEKIMVNGKGFYKDSDIEIYLEKDEHSPYTNASKRIAQNKLQRPHLLCTNLNVDQTLYCLWLRYRRPNFLTNAASISDT